MKRTVGRKCGGKPAPREPDPVRSAPRPGVAARLAAGALLDHVLDRGHVLEDALTQVSDFVRLEGSDRGFARALTSATLRELGRIDAVLAPLLDRPMADTPGPVRNLLRLGAAQLWCLDTPVHAAVGETVEAARARPETERAAGFLNAVLRKASGLGETFAAQPPEAAWPDSLVQALRDSLGVAGTRALARAARAEADLDLATWPGEAQALAERLGGRALGPTCVRLGTGEAVETLDGYQDGRWWVQDRAAQATVTLFGEVSGQSVIDLCAAPGGKALQLAAAGAHVTAIDRSRVRLERLRENAERTGLIERMTVVEADAASWRPQEPAQFVLLDAPCSALGTLRRHPEGAWIKSSADLARFPALQERLLRAALDMCAPDGLVVYCVCTPLRGEGADVVGRVLAEGLAVREPLPVQADIPDRWQTLQGDWLTLPDPDVEDGLHDVFFVSRLRRV